MGRQDWATYIEKHRLDDDEYDREVFKRLLADKGRTGIAQDMCVTNNAVAYQEKKLELYQPTRTVDRSEGKLQFLYADFIREVIAVVGSDLKEVRKYLRLMEVE